MDFNNLAFRKPKEQFNNLNYIVSIYFKLQNMGLLISNCNLKSKKYPIFTYVQILISYLDYYNLELVLIL